MLSSLCQWGYHHGKRPVQYRFKTAFVYHTDPLKRYLHGVLPTSLYWFNNLYGENKGYSMTRYQHLANLLAERIEQGLYRSGERLPSVRTLSQNTA